MESEQFGSSNIFNTSMHGFHMLRLTECNDGDLSVNFECQKWTSEFMILFRKEFGKNPIVKIGAYRNGQMTNVTIDIVSTQNPISCLTITVMITKNETILPKHDFEQMDMYLPGLVDTFYLVQLIAGNSSVSISS